jgi:hypothetical protein
MIAAVGIFIIVYLAIIVFIIAANWKIYAKAGQPGWACVVPFYNWYILTKIIGKPGWWMAMYFIPLVNIIFIIWSINLLSKSFGKDEGFTVGLIFLGIIFYPILGFGSAQYIGPYGDQAAFQAAQNPGFDFDNTNKS